MKTRQRTPAIERMVSKYEIAANGCWLWTARVSTMTGYAEIADWQGDRMVTRSAHRVMYEAVIGTVPEGFEIDHVCHTNDTECPGGRTRCLHRRCVNPSHLEAVTPSENTRRGRCLNRSKTYCVYGHPFDEENTYIRRNGNRDCRACLKVWRARYKLRSRMKAAA